MYKWPLKELNLTSQALSVFFFATDCFLILKAISGKKQKGSGFETRRRVWQRDNQYVECIAILKKQYMLEILVPLNHFHPNSAIYLQDFID